MVRWIKLTSPGIGGSFDNTFNEDIYVKPNGKLALLNMTLPLSTVFVNITDSNNTITFKTKDDPDYERTVTLANGKYTTPQILIELNKKVNGALTYDQPGLLNANSTQNTDVGFIWRFHINKSGKLNLSYYQSRIKPIAYDVLVGVNENNRVLSRIDTATNDDKAFGISRIPQLMSCSAYYTASQKGASDGTVTLLYGFVNSFDYATELPESEYAIAIKFQNTSYRLIINGVEVETKAATSMKKYDVPMLKIQNGKISAFIYRARTVNTDPTDILEFTETLSINEDLNYFPAFTLTGKDAEISVSAGNKDPYYKKTNSGITLVSEHDEENNYFDYGPIYDLDVSSDLGIAPPVFPSFRKILSNSQVTFSFTGDLGNVLGFNAGNFDMPGLLTYTEQATEELNDSLVPKNVIVELPNVHMQSYDGEQGYEKRRNILAVVPSLNVLADRLIHEPTYPVFIEMNNREPFKLRNIQVRILDSDNLVLDLDGKAELNLLLD